MTSNLNIDNLLRSMLNIHIIDVELNVINHNSPKFPLGDKLYAKGTFNSANVNYTGGLTTKIVDEMQLGDYFVFNRIIRGQKVIDVYLIAVETMWDDVNPLMFNLSQVLKLLILTFTENARNVVSLYISNNNNSTGDGCSIITRFIKDNYMLKSIRGLGRELVLL